MQDFHIITGSVESVSRHQHPTSTALDSEVSNTPHRTMCAHSNHHSILSHSAQSVKKREFDCIAKRLNGMAATTKPNTRGASKIKLESDAICYENHMLYAYFFVAFASHRGGWQRKNENQKQIWQGHWRFTYTGLSLDSSDSELFVVAGCSRKKL